MRPHNLRQPEPIEQRFWRSVTKSAEGCWIWTGYRNDKGYGRLSRGGRKGALVLAHRLAWELSNGAIPAGAVVCHRCDTPPCVRLDHLFLGQQRENVHDAVAKGRHRPPTPRRVTREIVARIREGAAAGRTHQAIADEVGLSRSYVTMIVNGARWA